MFSVVSLEYVFDDCAGFPEFDLGALVWVFDGGSEAVRVDFGGEGGFLRSGVA